MKNRNLLAMIAAGFITASGAAFAGEAQDKHDKDRDAATEAPQYAPDRDILAGNDAEGKDSKEKSGDAEKRSQDLDLIAGNDDGAGKKEKDKDSAGENPQRSLDREILAGNDADAKEKDKSKSEDSQHRELIDAHRAV